MGDGSVQVAPPLPQRRALQTHLGHLHRLQEHRLEDCQRAEAVSVEALFGEEVNTELWQM